MPVMPGRQEVLVLVAALAGLGACTAPPSITAQVTGSLLIESADHVHLNSSGGGSVWVDGLDLAAHLALWQTVKVQNPQLSWSVPSARVVGAGVNGPRAVHLADLNQDGHLDVVAGLYLDDKVIWYRNQGNGTFDAAQTISSATNAATAVYTADLDNDGDQDVLSASYQDDKVAWYRNDNGVFSNQMVLGTTNGARDVVAADMGTSGQMDVFAAGTLSDRIVQFPSTGSAFGSKIDLELNVNGPHVVRTGDLDQDGFVDVITAGSSDGTLYWLRNQGGSSFALETDGIIHAQLASPRDVQVADLNGDASLDIVVCNAYDNTVLWFANDGTGKFGPAQAVSSVLRSPTSLATVDLDEDGDLDIVCASGNDGLVSWLRNNGDGSFSAAMTLMSGAQLPYDVAAGDVDGDGHPDVVVASYSDDAIFWIRNDGWANLSETRLATA
ncbi:uncharacterized protein MONBRDRAFT_38366 [Monosiga brevicollis MX1]|uniref:VCBS repeat-containing protein n=1 Tax=Monosiga brevicollis TaxID=81824 RepID=A9V793_MONBE|nr:uncharacterized protein MONBRDRAFT_38366 [Monosiga brevicollis MX1]EDQ86474.1 predicted protein [Monosiga brevicollis MX1]|eukprot:XP_001748587.1 hypothetical protein [Monosiga brevicollis MX1]